MKILVLRPDFDLATRFGAYYLGRIIPRLRLYGPLKDLYKPDPEDAQIAVEQFDPDIVIGEGHGLEGIYTLQYKRTWLISCVNDQIMKGRYVYLISCRCGRSLGRSMVRKGAKMFAGYDADFIFLADSEDPEKDNYAGSFFDAALRIALNMVSTQDPNRVLAFGKEVWNYWYNAWKRVDDIAAPLALGFMAHNRDHFVVYPAMEIKEEPVKGLSLAVGGALALLSVVGLSR